jgi:hypothetical protein
MLPEINDLSRIERRARPVDANARRRLGAQRALIIDVISLLSVRHSNNDGTTKQNLDRHVAV